MPEFLNNPGLLAALSVASVVTFVGSLIGIPWIVARLPEDYFSTHSERRSFWQIENPRTRAIYRVGKNIAGAILLLAGIAMLALPGQGLITILVAIALLDIPGKHRLLAKLASRPGISRALNAIRRRQGQPPLEFDD